MRYVCILTILFLTSLSFAQTRAFVIVDTSGISDSVLIRWNQGTRKFTTVPYASVAMDTSEVLAYTKSLISGGGQQYSDTTTWDATKTWAQGGNILLDQIGNPGASKTFTMANKTLTWTWTTPTGGMDYNMTGAYTGDLIHIHQHTGNPGAGVELMHIEASDADVTALHINVANDTAVWVDAGNVFIDGALTVGGVAFTAKTDDADSSTWLATKTWAQPAEATLTDIADGTIAENLVNTANPWADNEIASSATWNTVGLEVGRQVGSVFVSKTFTNIGTSFVDVYVTAFDAEDMMIIDFTNADSVSAVFIWDYIGAGKQYVQWVDVADNSKILLSSLEMNGDADATRIEWAALPAWFVNKKLTIEWQGKSLTAADDPVAKGYVLYLK